MLSTKARQKSLDRLVALKLVRSVEQPDPQHLLAFRLEAEAIAKLQHPNIVQIYEVGEHWSSDCELPLPYLALEYLEGGTFAEKLHGQPLNHHDSAKFIEKLARAIHTVHEKHLVHRDLKPSNILLDVDGEPKITDFGLAKRLDQQGFTQTGTVLGTPAYMAPEQAAGRIHEIGPASDIYALGAILYECLTGNPPFRGVTPTDILLQITQQEPIHLESLRLDCPQDLTTICHKCLEKETRSSLSDVSRSCRGFTTISKQ